MIFSSVTEGVIVTAQPQYLEEHSAPAKKEFVFAYHIRIENESPYTVQLLERHWIIFDGHGRTKEVKGTGVIGLQPILKPGDVHEYNSWSPIQSEIGFMRGFYTMLRKEDLIQFQVEIPRFELVVPYISN